ncbi:MAG: hypothetical protein AB1641_29885 [Thermodesulfobacteriota bacterium]
MADRSEWQGTATDLLSALTDTTSPQVVNSKAWPKAPHVLSSRLTRGATFLRNLGVDVELGTRSKSGRVIKIWLQTSAHSVHSDAFEENQSVRGDASYGETSSEKFNDFTADDADDADDASLGANSLDHDYDETGWPDEIEL